MLRQVYFALIIYNHSNSFFHQGSDWVYDRVVKPTLKTYEPALNRMLESLAEVCLVDHAASTQLKHSSLSVSVRNIRLVVLCVECLHEQQGLVQARTLLWYLVMEIVAN